MSPSSRWTLQRAAYFLIAPLAALILFERAFHVWFLADDFAWLGLRLEVHRPADLLHVLFSPQAQGTIRFLSERLVFLTFYSLFGLNALPFRLLAFTTWCADLTLAAVIGTRLTGSRAAGLFAAILWTSNAALVRPLAWASAYNEVMFALCILVAFYARLRWIDEGRRKWIALEWSAYLLGFGALELIVVYPLLAALHAWCCARKRLLSTLPLFVPAAIFSALHLLFIPKNAGPYYVIALDRRVFSTFVYYLNQTIEPVRIGNPPQVWLTIASIAGILIIAALLVFAILRFRRDRSLVPVFFAAWFVAALLPVLILPNHLTEYYETVPALGLAWLAGWAIERAWVDRGSLALVGRAATVILCAAYFAGSYRALDIYVHWLDDNSTRIRNIVYAAAELEENHPGNWILLTRLDTDSYDAGFDGLPFRLAGVDNVRIAPGEERLLQPNDAASVHHYIISPAAALALLDHDRARVLDVSRSPMHDVTRSFTAALRVNPETSRRDFVDAGDPEYASQLGPTPDSWFGRAAGFQWMTTSGTVKLSGIRPDAQNLYVTGFNPGPEYSRAPVTLRLLGNGRLIGSTTLTRPGEQFAFSLPLPPELRGVKDVELEIDLDRVIHLPGDNHEMGIVFGTFSIR